MAATQRGGGIGPPWGGAGSSLLGSACLGGTRPASAASAASSSSPSAAARLPPNPPPGPGLRALLTGGTAPIRTAAAMEVACSVAAAASGAPAGACRGGCRRLPGPGTGTGTGPCRCAAVAFVRHASLRGGGDDPFPLRLRGASHGGGGSGGSGASDGSDGSDGWDEEALGRIRVRYVEDRGELLRYLASVPAMPPHRRPLGGIVLDGTEIFLAAGGRGRGGALGPDAAQALSQIVALLGHTADFLDGERRGRAEAEAGAPPAAAVVVLDGASLERLPPHVGELLHNWLPDRVTLRGEGEGEGEGDHMGGDRDEVWAVDVRRDGGAAAAAAAPEAERRGGWRCWISHAGGASDGMPEALWEEVLQEEPESPPRPPQ